jgi:hypothetical protein
MTRTLEIAVVLAALAVVPSSALGQAAQCIELPPVEQMSLAALANTALPSSAVDQAMSRDERLTSMTLEPRAMPITKAPLQGFRFDRPDPSDAPALWCSSGNDRRCAPTRNGDVPRHDVRADSQARGGTADLPMIPAAIETSVDFPASSLGGSPGFRTRIERPPRSSSR